ncbi:cytochrome P450 [Aromatoleum toluclasticum]|uniref:cytochrome P450 n=1 Tax=Aromatoleum toluclasticum TaxID=92003 RepID=UPI001D187EEB|nr:cytochrome P450 [Aromatoleum toluclasticum]MCC4114706.1 cytochrome P450 [Aromatoleum toluclasticum]
MKDEGLVLERAEIPSILSFADKDPFGYYDELRKHGSPVWDEKAQAWLVLDYEQCVEVEASEEVFGNIYMNADPILLEVKGGRANVTVSQGEEHERLRKFHLALLSARAVESYREHHVQPIVGMILGRIAGKGRADLKAEFAQQVVPRVICSLMGMPWDDDRKMARILQLNEDIVAFIGNNYRGEELKAQALAASAELNEMLRPYIRERRENPADDFISRVWQEAPTQYGELTEADAIAICRELYFAASDTTIHGISNALYVLLTNEDVRRQVQADRKTALTNLVEEGLRLYSVVQMRHRIAKQDVVIGGKEIRKGELLLLVHAAANRDPAQYSCPHAAKLDRPRPAVHMAFGRGPRSCIGAQLARAEMREMLGTLLDRLPNLRLDPDATPPSFAGFYMRSFGPLNVVWDV